MARFLFEDQTFCLNLDGRISHKPSISLAGSYIFPVYPLETPKDTRKMKTLLEGCFQDIRSSADEFGKILERDLSEIVYPQIYAAAASKAIFDVCREHHENGYLFPLIDSPNKMNTCKEYIEYLQSRMIEQQDVYILLQELSGKIKSPNTSDISKKLSSYLLYFIANNHGDGHTSLDENDAPFLLRAEQLYKKYITQEITHFLEMNGLSDAVGDDGIMVDSRRASRIIRKRCDDALHNMDAVVEEIKNESKKRHGERNPFAGMLPSNQKIHDDFMNTMRKAPRELFPLLSLAIAGTKLEQPLELMFFRNITKAESPRYVPQARTAGCYSRNSHTAYLPTEDTVIDCEQPFKDAKMPDMFEPLRNWKNTNSDGAKTTITNTRESAWFEEVFHAALNALYDNDILPHAKNDNEFVSGFMRALKSDINHSAQNLDSPETKRLANHLGTSPQQLKALAEYDDKQFASLTEERFFVTSTERELPVKLWTDWAESGDKEYARKAAPGCFDFLERKIVQKEAGMGCKKQRISTTKIENNTPGGLPNFS